MNWRPKEGWGNNVDCDCPFFSDSTGDPINCSQRHNDYEAGASAMLSAVIKWLDEPCDKHRLEDEDFGQVETYIGKGRYGYYSHRSDCPQCMAELRGEK